MITATSAHFDVTIKERTIHIKRISVSGDFLYLATSDGMMPVCLHRVENIKEKGYWTSIPAGRQREAEIIGRLIEKYLSQGN